MIKYLLFLLLTLYGYGVKGQCFSIDAGNDLQFYCNDPCSTLVGNYVQTFETNTYTISSIPYNPNPYNVGTLYSIPIDDRWSGVLNLPFTFCFFGNQFNQFVLGTNGVISFNLSYANLYCPWPFTATIPNANAAPPPGFPRSMIGLYHDIDPSVASDPTEPCQPNCGEVRYGVYGNYPCRKFIVSFNDIPHYNCNSLRSKFQIVLYELTNVIEIHVEKKQTCGSWNGGRACLGIQNGAGTIGYAPVGRNTANYTIVNPEAWRFSPNGPVSSSPKWLDQNGNIISNNNILNYCFNSGTYTFRVDFTCPQNQPLIDNVNVNIIDTTSVDLYTN
jgi:hypothetical protein